MDGSWQSMECLPNSKRPLQEGATCELSQATKEPTRERDAGEAGNF